MGHISGPLHLYTPVRDAPSAPRSQAYRRVPIRPHPRSPPVRSRSPPVRSRVPRPSAPVPHPSAPVPLRPLPFPSVRSRSPPVRSGSPPVRSRSLTRSTPSAPLFPSVRSYVPTSFWFPMSNPTGPIMIVLPFAYIKPGASSIRHFPLLQPTSGPETLLRLKRQQHRAGLRGFGRAGQIVGQPLQFFFPHSRTRLYIHSPT